MIISLAVRPDNFVTFLHIVQSQCLKSSEKADLKSDENPKDVDVKEKSDQASNHRLSFEFKTEGDPEKELIAKCLCFMLQGRLPLKPAPVKVS